MSGIPNIESDMTTEVKPNDVAAGSPVDQENLPTVVGAERAGTNVPGDAEPSTQPPLSVPADSSEPKPFMDSEQQTPVILAQLETLLDQAVEKILGKFEEKLSFDRFKEDQISRLHSELQEYKSDLISKTAKPLANGIIRLHDDIGRIVCALKKQDQSALTHEKFFNVINGFQQDIEVILSQNGVEAYREDPSTFDPRRQKALTTVPTSDLTKVGHIAARLHPGFEQGNTLLQKERVAVYALAAPAASSAQAAETVADNSDRTAQGEKP